MANRGLPPAPFKFRNASLSTLTFDTVEDSEDSEDSEEEQPRARAVCSHFQWDDISHLNERSLDDVDGDGAQNSSDASVFSR